MSGTNLQNLKRGSIVRQMLIPDLPTDEFCNVDLWAAEAYVTALDADEPYMLALLEKGTKIHAWFLEQTTNEFPDAVKLAEYNYHKAKQSIHSLNYGVRPDKMSMESGLPTKITNWQYSFFHGTFPNIRVRQSRIETELRDTHILTSLLGRSRIFVAPMSPKLLNQAYAWPSQSVIGELTIAAMTKLWYFGRLFEPNFKVVLNAHDGVLLNVPRCRREEIKKMVKSCFNIPLTKEDTTIQIPISVSWGNNYNDFGEEEVLRYE